jgi:hypothetical protein
MKNVIYTSMTPFLVLATFIGLMTTSNWMMAEEKARKAEEQQLRERETRARLWVSLKLEALEELVEDRCTLPQASEHLLKLLEPHCEPQLRLRFPADTTEQSLALQIISNVQMLPLEAAKADEVTRRLEKQFEQMKASAQASSR